MFFFFSSRRRHTRFWHVTGVQTCALPISFFSSVPEPLWSWSIGHVRLVFIMNTCLNCGDNECTSLMEQRSVWTRVNGSAARYQINKRNYSILTFQTARFQFIRSQGYCAIYEKLKPFSTQYYSKFKLETMCN